jgi:LPS-assembly protein
MSMKYLLVALVSACAVVAVDFSCPTRAAERTTAGGKDEINLNADKLSTSEGGAQIEASGNVEIRREEMTLKAEEVRYNRTTQDVEARGKVVVDDPEWKLRSADSLRLNMENETGVIENGDIFMENGHVSMTGRRFEKFGGQTYHIDDGFFTTCLCETGAPTWKFYAEQMDLSLEGTGTIKNGYFYVFDTPVFYIPYAIFPLSTERQTGFLFPTLGQSSKEGFRYLQPFFWAISKSSDATVELDVETRARIGGIGEFRTLFDRDSDFRIASAYFNESLRKNAQDDVVDKTLADPEIPKNRWSVVGTHRYTLGSDWLTFSDFAAFRDDLFVRELIERFDVPDVREATLRRSRFGESRFGLFRNWDNTFLKGEWRFYQDFIQPDSGTLQRTPQISFWGHRFLSGLPLEFRWRAEGINYLRREGGDGVRLDLRPELVAPFRAGPYLFGSLSVAPRETLYHLYTPVKSSDHNVSRELVEVHGNISTSLSRVFTFNRPDLIAMKHVIEPEVSYLFIPKVDQSRIPIMDDIDRIGRRNVVTFSLANRFWGKAPGRFPAFNADNEERLNPYGGGDVRDLGFLKVGISYDIAKAQKDSDRLSDIDVKLRTNPLSFLGLSLEGNFHPAPWEVTSLQTYLGLTDPRPLPRRYADPDFVRPNFFNIGYAFVRQNPNSFYAEDANIDLEAPATPAYCQLHPADPRCSSNAASKDVAANVGTNALYHVTDNILLYGTTSVDARQGRFLGFSVATKFLSFCECWSVTLGLRQTVNPDKTSFYFNFNLAGLGNQKSTLK